MRESKNSSFQTVFVNNRDYVFEVRGLEPLGIRLLIPPGEERTVLSPSVFDVYSPFERVIYEADRTGESVELKKRRGWKEPPRPFPSVEFLNLDGHECEILVLGEGKALYLPKGIPVLSEVHPFSQYAEWNRWLLAGKKRTRNDPNNPMLLVEILELCSFGEQKRSGEELERLEKLRKSLIEEERRQRGLG